MVDQPTLLDQILAIHRHLDTAELPHAFGGALALAMYTDSPRAANVIDVNITVGSDSLSRVLDALPSAVVPPVDVAVRAVADDQFRAWWGNTPVDVFLHASEFHTLMNQRVEFHTLARVAMPFICADDLAVLKALFDRPKDWLDIAEMVSAGSVHLGVVSARTNTGPAFSNWADPKRKTGDRAPARCGSGARQREQRGSSIDVTAEQLERSAGGGVAPLP